MPPTDSPPIAGPVLIEDDDETIYNPITPTPDAVVEHLEDSLTIPDDDSSDVVTVYDDCDSLTMEKPLADTSSRVNHQIPIEVSVDITLPSTAENLNNSDAVKELLDKMKEPLSNLDKEWISLHQQLNHLPHSEMMRLVKAGFLDKKFLKLINSDVLIASLQLRLGPVLGTNHPRIKKSLIPVKNIMMYLDHVYQLINWCQLYLV